MTAHNLQTDFTPFRARHGEALLPEAPILARQDHGQPSVFLPEVMLREARKQKKLAGTPVPPVCLLDPDGDITAFVQRELGAARSPSWACFHTELWEWTDGGERFGIVARAVGAPFAVLVAEQLFVSGCELLISISSAGAIAPGLPKPAYVLIERAPSRRGHELPLFAARTLRCRGAPCLCGCLGRSRFGRASCHARYKLDHRRAIPRNGCRHRRAAAPRRAYRRDGSCSPSRFRASQAKAACCDCPHHQRAGAGARRFR